MGQARTGVTWGGVLGSWKVKHSPMHFAQKALPQQGVSMRFRLPVGGTGSRQIGQTPLALVRRGPAAYAECAEHAEQAGSDERTKPEVLRTLRLACRRNLQGDGRSSDAVYQKS